MTVSKHIFTVLYLTPAIPPICFSPFHMCQVLPPLLHELNNPATQLLALPWVLEIMEAQVRACWQESRGLARGMPVGVCASCFVAAALPYPRCRRSCRCR